MQQRPGAGVGLPHVHVQVAHNCGLHMLARPMCFFLQPLHQFLNSACVGSVQEDVPDLWSRIAQGDFTPALQWLREKVHVHGHIQDAPEIFLAAVGDRDPVADLMTHLRSRQGALYGE